jgi:Mn-containing catalase
VVRIASLDPWQERGIPLDRQIRSWKQIVQEPYDKHDVDAYTRCRIILMNGIENEAWAWGHQFHRSAGNDEIRSLLAQTRRIEDQQQTTINWLNPADQTILETTIAFEQVAVDLTAYLARNEPDPYLRETLNFGLLEDFDHLYRYSELLDLLEGKDSNTILQGQTDVLPGRPTIDHHNAPLVRLLKHYEKNRALPLSKLHVLTLLSAEQQTHSYYKSHGFMYPQPLARQLYAEIAEVEEEHVTQYGSLLDPAETPLERQVLHELMEVYNYFHCYEHETDPRIKAIWEEFLHMELEHLQQWGAMLQKYEGIEPQTLFGTELQVEFRFQENKQYVREVLEKQRDLRLLNRGWVWKNDLPRDWPSYAYQQRVNADGVPSEKVVDIQQVGAGDGRPGEELLARARQIAVRARGERK